MKLARSLALGIALSLFLARGSAQDEGVGTAKTISEFAAEHEERLRSHSHFSKVLMAPDEAAGPVLLYLQPPQIETEGWREKLRAEHLPWLARVEANFRKTLAEPLRLQRRPDLSANPVCVLQTFGDFVNYSDAVASSEAVGQGAHFERKSRWTVTYQSGGKLSPLERRRTELFEFMHALLHSYYRGDGGEMYQVWLSFGLSSYFSDGLGTTPESLDAHTYPVAALTELQAHASNPLRRDVYLIPIESLVRATRFGHLRRAAEQRAEQSKLKLDDTQFSSSMVHHCALWTHFLLDHGGPQRRQSFLTYIALALNGQGGGNAFEKSFEGVSLDELDREFYRWVFRERLRLDPKAQADLADVEKLFRAPTPKPAEGPAGAVVSALDDFSDVAPPSDDLVAAHGEVLQLVRGGALARALERCIELEARAKGAAIERRVQRETPRIRALIQLRDAQVADWIASGAKKSLTVGDKKVVARVLAYADGVLTFDENRQNVSSAPVEALSFVELFKDLGKELSAGPSGWARYYPSVLDGDERSVRRLAADRPAEAELRDDYETWYPGVVRAGAAAASLRELSAGGAPTDAADAHERLDRIQALLTRDAALELVVSRRDALTRLALSCAERTFSFTAAVGALPGRVESLDADRIRWSIDFRSKDWPASLLEQRPEILASYRKTLYERQPVPPASLEVTDDGVQLLGSSSWRLSTPFEGPLEISADIHVGKTEVDGQPAALRILAAYVDDGAYVMMAVNGNMYAAGPPLVVPAEKWDNPPYFTGADYAMRLELGARQARAFVGGAPRGELDVGGERAGHIVLTVHSMSPITLRELTIVGRPRLSELRELWVHAQLTRVGLGSPADDR